MLKSVTLRRFKNLSDVTIPLERVNVLIGTNNSGKSSVLQGVQFAISVAQTAKLLDSPNTLSPEQLIYAPLRDVAALAEGGVLVQAANKAIEIAFTQELVEADGTVAENSTTVQIRRGKNKNLAVGVTGGLKGALESLDTPYAMYVPGLAGVPSSEPYRTPAALRRAAARGDANAVLRNVLLSLKGDATSWAAFSAHLHSVFPDHQVVVRFDPNVDELVEAEVVSPRGTFPIDAAGTGFLQTVQILAYTAKYRPPLLLLDEPDSHIHPDRQRRLVALLAKLAQEQDFQVLIATHSRHLLDQLNQGARFHWMSGGGRIPEDEPDRVRVLTDLGALDSGDLLKQGQVDAVLLTEDSDQAYLKALLEASGFDMARTQVWSYSGCTKIDSAVVLSRFIQENAPGTEVIVHRDRDYLAEAAADELVDDFSKKGLRLFLTRGTDAESHFLDPNHIVALYPTVSEEQVRGVVTAATLETREKSEKLLAAALLASARAERRAAGKTGDPDIVAITDAARAAYAADPARWRHGKKTLGHAVVGLHSLLGERAKLVRPSYALRVQVLADAALAAAARRTSALAAAPASPVPPPTPSAHPVPTPVAQVAQ